MRVIKILAIVSFFASPVFSQSKDIVAVARKVEALRLAMINADSSQLNSLVVSWLSYGHSTNVVENKKQFITSLISGKYDFTDISLKEQSIVINNNIAIVRHKLFGETHDKDKPPSLAKLGVLLIWQKIDKKWMLVARQACKL